VIGRWTMLVLFALASATVAAPIPLDVVFPKGGDPLVGRVKDVETLFLVVVVAGTPEPARIGLGDIDWVDFGESQLMNNFLRKAVATPAPELQKFWEQRRALLEVPGSTGGVIGLRYAQRLLVQRTLTAAGHALEVADLIVQKDWSAETKQDARLLRVAALLALGRGLDAASALHQMEETALGARQRSMMALMQGDVELQLGNRQAALEHYLKPFIFGGPLLEQARVGLERARDVARDWPEATARLSAIEKQLAGFKGDGSDRK